MPHNFSCFSSTINELTETGGSRNLPVMLSSYSLSVTVTCRHGRGWNEEDRSGVGMDGDLGSGVALHHLVAGTGGAT